jgi:uncharacterized protein (TIGR02466 family)
MTSPQQLTMHHMDLFPTRVWTVDLALLNPHVPDWIAAIEALRTAHPQPAGRSNRMGWNSALTLFDDARFAPLEHAVRSIFDAAFAEMGPPTYPYRLKAWANVHDGGGYNTFHHHAGALLSACYYLQLPEGSGKLTLRDPRAGAMLSPWQGSLRPNAGSEISIAPLPGQLLLFPSWLEHATEPHTGATARLSIPINAMPLMGLDG